MSDETKLKLVPGTQTAFYISQFITPEEEDYLIRKINESPQQKWKHLSNRRLQIWGGDLTEKNVLISQSLPQYITQFPDLVGRIKDTGVFTRAPHGAPNHVILNEYLPGQGIMPHEDGPSYHPVVATLSLGSHSVFHYYQYRSEGMNTETSSIQDRKGRIIDPTPVVSMLLEPRSLVITTSDLYTGHLHGIDGLTEDKFPLMGGSTSVTNVDLLTDTQIKDVVERGGSLQRGVRYSLTCRDVERVVGARFGVGRRK